MESQQERDKNINSPIAPLECLFDTVIIQVSLKQANNKLEEFLLVKKTIIESPIVLGTQAHVLVQ
jgi:hypothetical protein